MVVGAVGINQSSHAYGGLKVIGGEKDWYTK